MRFMGIKEKAHELFNEASYISRINKKMTTPDTAAPTGRWRALAARCLNQPGGGNTVLPAA